MRGVAVVLFGLLAAFLVAVGLYGTISYSVSRRTMEIGVRMALGAPRREVVGMVLRQGALLAAAGLAIGVPMAFVVGRALRSQGDLESVGSLRAAAREPDVLSIRPKRS